MRALKDMLNKIECFCLISVFIIIALLPLNASMILPVEHKCPICGNVFKSLEVTSMTCRSKRLDGRMMNCFNRYPVIKPICSKCHFILFKENLSENDLSILKNFVYSEEYKIFEKSHSSYFIIAKMKELLWASYQDIAYSYLYASWQVEADKVRHLEYLNLSINFLNKYYSEKIIKNKQYYYDRILYGEILRLKGNFNEALDVFEELSQVKKKYLTKYKRTIAFEISLAEKHDNNSYCAYEKPFLCNDTTSSLNLLEEIKIITPKKSNEDNNNLNLDDEINKLNQELKAIEQDNN